MSAQPNNVPTFISQTLQNITYDLQPVIFFYFIIFVPFCLAMSIPYTHIYMNDICSDTNMHGNHKWTSRRQNVQETSSQF